MLSCAHLWMIRFLNKSILLILCCFAINAQAAVPIFGNTVEILDPLQFPSFCNISLINSEGISQSCSAALIGAKKIVTSRHCIPPSFDLKKDLILIACGNQSWDEAAKIEVLPAIHSVNASDDLALIELLEKTTLPTLSITRYPSLYFSLNGRLQKNVKCSVYGYGKNLNPAQTGKLQRLQINPQANFLFSPDGFLELSHLENNSVQYGDSGGALLCQIGNQTPELVAVTSSFGSDSVTQKVVWNRFTPVFIPYNLSFLVR